MAMRTTRLLRRPGEQCLAQGASPAIPHHRPLRRAAARALVEPARVSVCGRLCAVHLDHASLSAAEGSLSPCWALARRAGWGACSCGCWLFASGSAPSCSEGTRAGGLARIDRQKALVSLPCTGLRPWPARHPMPLLAWATTGQVSRNLCSGQWVALAGPHALASAVAYCVLYCVQLSRPFASFVATRGDGHRANLAFTTYCHRDLTNPRLGIPLYNNLDISDNLSRVSCTVMLALITEMTPVISARLQSL